MTTSATAPDVPAAITLPRGVARAMRLHLVNLTQMLGWPWGILAIAFVINLAIFAAGASKGGEGTGTGGLASLYIVMMIGYLQSMTQLFPFALGIGVSRRSFYLGTTLFAAAESLLYGTIIYLISVVEVATGGWGVNLSFFRVPWLTTGASPLELLATYAVPLFALAALAMFVGAVHKRWGSNGVLTLTAAATLVLGGISVLVTWSGSWPAVGDWFADQGPLSLAVGWPLVLAAAGLAGGWLVVRRATP